MRVICFINFCLLMHASVCINGQNTIEFPGLEQDLLTEYMNDSTVLVTTFNRIGSDTFVNMYSVYSTGSNFDPNPEGSSSIRTGTTPYQVVAPVPNSMKYVLVSGERLVQDDGFTYYYLFDSSGSSHLLLDSFRVQSLWNPLVSSRIDPEGDFTIYAISRQLDKVAFIDCRIRDDRIELVQTRELVLRDYDLPTISGRQFFVSDDQSLVLLYEKRNILKISINEEGGLDGTFIYKTIDERVLTCHVSPNKKGLIIHSWLDDTLRWKQYTLEDDTLLFHSLIDETRNTRRWGSDLSNRLLNMSSYSLDGDYFAYLSCEEFSHSLILNKLTDDQINISSSANLLSYGGNGVSSISGVKFNDSGTELALSRILDFYEKSYSTMLFKIRDPSSTSESSIKSTVKIFPNPSRSYVNVVSDEVISNIEVLTISGQRLTLNKLASNSIDTSSLPAGLYIVRVYLSNGAVYNQTMVKV